MKYDLIIFEIEKPNAYTILAHQLARNPSITMQKAFDMLEKLPVVLFKNIDESSIQGYIMQYYQHGVILKAQKSNAPFEQSYSGQSLAALKKTALQLRLNENYTVKVLNTPKTCESSTGLKSDTQETKPKRYRIKSASLIVLALITVLLVGLVALLFDENRVIYNFARRNRYAGVSFLPTNVNIKARKRVSTEQKLFSEEMVDSAKVIDYDLNRMIKFYKIAISFNRYNLNAWMGLRSMYKRANMEDQHQQCMKEMEEIFGDQVFSTSSIVQNYGMITDSYVSEDSIMVVSYRSETKPDEPLLREMHMITRSLEAQQHLHGITLSAIYSKNKEIIVHVRPGMHTETFDDFKQNASIHIFR